MTASKPNDTSATGDPLKSLVEAAGGIAGSSASDAGEPLPTVTGRPAPPIENWHPAYCGEMDMEIRADGSWWHEGTAIRRHEFVRLFASILKRESDGEYYLVTPAEKVRIRVQLHPLMVVDAEYSEGPSGPTLMLSLNTGGCIPLDAEHPLALEPAAGNAAYVTLGNGLTALFSRAAWYRLVELADDAGIIHSAGQAIALL